MSTDVLEGFGLSPQQRSLWRLQQRDSGTPARSRCVIRIDGNLDPGLLGRALEKALERHEILRTYFPTLPGMSEPLQAIAEAQPLSLAEQSFVDLLPAEQEKKVEQLARELPEISRGPAVKAAILRLAPTRSLLVLVLPALCADARTLELLAREVGELYGSLLGGRDLPAPSIQYADVAQWLNDLLESEMPVAVQSYWKQNDTVDLASVELPFRRPSSDGSGESRSRAVPLSRELTNRIDEVAARVGFGPSVVLLAGLQVLIWRFTGTSEFVLARETDGRHLRELQDALGPLARYLPLACRLTETASFSEFAAGVGQRTSEQELWQEYVPSDAQSGSGKPAEGALAPSIGFEYRELPKPCLAAGISFSVESVKVEPGRFPLQVECVRRQDGTLHVGLHYDSRHYADQDIRYFADAFGNLLRSAASAPETPVERLSILGEPQRSQLLATFNETRNDGLRTAPVYRLFEEQAQRTPDRTALICEDRRVFFSEANAQANWLARRLRDLGVGPDSVVGLLLERSLESVMAVLGIWKSGGAYLPLEVSTPRERQKFMLRDAGASILLTQETFRDSFRNCPCPIVTIEDIGERPAGQDESDLPADAGPENLAYVIYTSGSTGQPKGVAVEHRQLSNYVDAILTQLRPAEGSAFATVSTFAADLGHTSIFPPLISGGCLHVIAQERASDPDALANYFQANLIDYLKIVPSHLAALLTGSRPEGVLPRRCVVLGGEALTWELVERIRELAPDCGILNHYGPTETTVGATTFVVSSSDRAAVSRTVPIGRPLANVQAYVLDGLLEPVPLWAPGELFLGGRGVARGYQNRAELTRERFLDDPFRPGNRIYRTGDLARLLPDGNIEWLGRTDQQVKLRGFRVELGEIEAKLREHEAIAECVLLLREDTPGEKRLVAYCVLSGTPAVADQELKDFLRATLPEFMIPAAFVYLSRLPLTPNGKIDRRTLPPPDSVKRESHTEAAVPRNAAEEELVRIWREILRLEQIGIHDNFFHLGGDSILAIQIVARANRAGLRLTPRQLFQHQTVAELAGVIGQAGVVTIDQERVSGPVPLTPIQHWFFEQDLSDPHHYNQAILLEARETLSPAVVEETVERLVAHHDALRLRFTRGADGWRQNNDGSEQGRVFSRVDLGSVGPEELPALVEDAASKLQASLDLTAGPLLRIALLDRRPEQPSRLLFIVHHLAVDGVSWRVLLEDFRTAYGQRLEGKEIELPAKTTSFQVWATRLVTHARSGALDPEFSYWLAQESREVRPLPRDFVGKPNTVESEAVVSMSLTAEETKSLLQDVPVAYGTQINDALLTSLLRALTSWTGERSLLVDLEGHGREEIVEGVNLSRTVGWFTSRFPLLLAADEPSDIAEALKQVKEQLRSVPHRGIGYGLLRYLSARSADSAALASLPQPEISFNYLGQLDSRFGVTSIFTLGAESVGPTRSQRQMRRHLLSVDGSITAGRLRFSWTYSEAVHRRATIEQIASKFAESLRALIAHCVSPEAGGYTPSDFPKAKLSRKALDKLVSRLD